MRKLFRKLEEKAVLTENQWKNVKGESVPPERYLEGILKCAENKKEVEEIVEKWHNTSVRDWGDTTSRLCWNLAYEYVRYDLVNAVRVVKRLVGVEKFDIVPRQKIHLGTDFKRHSPDLVIRKIKNSPKLLNWDWYVEYPSCYESWDDSRVIDWAVKKLDSYLQDCIFSQENYDKLPKLLQMGVDKIKIGSIIPVEYEEKFVEKMTEALKEDENFYLLNWLYQDGQFYTGWYFENQPNSYDEMVESFYSAPDFFMPTDKEIEENNLKPRDEWEFEDWCEYWNMPADADYYDCDSYGTWRSLTNDEYIELLRGIADEVAVNAFNCCEMDENVREKVLELWNEIKDLD